MKLPMIYAVLLLTASCSKAEVFSGELLVIGDSLSTAHGMSPEQGWVHLLQSRIHRESHDYSVYNLSASGATSQEALGRLRKLLPTRTPVIAVIAIGGNDGLRGQPIVALRANLVKMIEMLLNVDARVLLLPMHVPDNYGAKYSKSFNQVYYELMDQYDLPQVAFLLDGVHDSAELMQADRIHPTAAAQGRILDNIWSALEPVL